MLSPQDAVKREVEEESGLTFEPEAVILVECLSAMWVRVTFTGMIHTLFGPHGNHLFTCKC